ncbi:MAG TPA: hypothetical protein VG326_08160 [Tepidisphaeraceae bacterium]|jgi:hypothetical protein|nr:hypothetical protein [Tepidisphaeraceae bacterium]
MTAIKCLALLILLLAVAAIAGICGCRMMGVDAHGHEMLLADSIALGAAVAAAIPALSQQGRLDTAGTFQAALVGSVLHLGLIFIVAVILVMMKRAATPFVLWLLAAYWATLVGLCITFARLIRTAPKAVAKEIGF